MRTGSFHPSFTDVDTTAQATLGAIYEGTNGQFKYVKFSGTTTVAVGDVVCYVSSDHALTTVDGANSGIGAGVAMAAVPSGAVAYGYIQISGVVTLSGTIGGATSFGTLVTTQGTNASAGHLGLLYAATQPADGRVITSGTAAAANVIDATFPP